MALPPHVNAGDRVIVFDGVCRLCNGVVNFLLRHDRQGVFRLCSAQSTEGRAILCWFGHAPERLETLLLVEGDNAYERSDAALRIARCLPFPWRALVLFRGVPRRWRDAVYNLIARHRYRWFGRFDHCQTPPDEYRDRFLGGPG